MRYCDNKNCKYSINGSCANSVVKQAVVGAGPALVCRSYEPKVGLQNNKGAMKNE